MYTMDTRSWIAALGKEPFYTSVNSVIVRHGDLLLKFHRPRRFPKDHLRRYAGNALAVREVRAYRLMQRLGLPTPKVIGTRIFWNPLARFDSISACEFLEDTVTAKIFLASAAESERRAVIDQVTEHLQRMWNAWVLYRELNLINILVDKNLAIYWVDPAMKRFFTYRSMRNASDRLLGQHMRTNHKILGCYGMEKLCSLALPKRRLARVGWFL